MDDLQYLKKYYKGDINDAYALLAQGQPVQYIVGDVDFLGNLIKVNKNVLIPRFETELLVSKTIDLAKKIFNHKIDILDIGTGSGCIAISLKKSLDANVTASDISNLALEVATTNATLNNVDINFITSDIFTNIEGKYDLIISNPPYIKESDEVDEVVLKNEPHLALYAKNNGLYFYEQIISEARVHLKDKYVMAFEIGDKQGDDILKLAHQYFGDSQILKENDLNDKNRYIFIIKS